LNRLVLRREEALQGCGARVAALTAALAAAAGSARLRRFPAAPVKFRRVDGSLLRVHLLQGVAEKRWVVTESNALRSPATASSILVVLDATPGLERHGTVTAEAVNSCDPGRLTPPRNSRPRREYWYRCSGVAHADGEAALG